MTSHFEMRFNSNTSKRKNTLVGRLFANKVILEIASVNSTEMRLAYIETPMQYRMQGLASEALSWLCELADECEMKLCLTPCNTQETAMNVIQLTAWYQKFGFVRIGLKDEMVRYPHATK